MRKREKKNKPLIGAKRTISLILALGLLVSTVHFGFAQDNTADVTEAVKV